ncbi:MAG TPA: ABC transporter substrate-binding protein [Geminicoccaceae bacterium]|nr:ABC transporter substrate-binding protein [Geminicoccaceae bacterium]
MTKHSTRLAAALAVMVAPALATAETVRVGVVMTYSGGGAQFAQQIERAMELYLEQEGRAKLGEHEIELIKRDARNPGGDAAKTAVQELIVREDVDLLTGFVYSPNIIASAPLIDQGKVPTLVLNAATAWIPSLSPYIARVSMTMWQTGYPMGGYAFEKLECDTAAVGYTDYPPGKDALEAFRLGFEQAGGELIDAIPMGGPAEVPDFTPFMQRVKDAAPDCFFVFVPSGNHVAAVFKTYADLGMRDAGIRLIGPGDLTQDTELQGMGEDAVGAVTLGQYQADLDVGNNRAFVAAWHEAYGEDSTPDFMAAAGWDGMAAIVDAIVQQNGQIDPDRTMEIWAGWTHEGPRGTVMIDPETRDIVQDMKVNEIYAEDGRLKMRTIDVIPQVKDPCKEQKVGRCAE